MSRPRLPAPVLPPLPETPPAKVLRRVVRFELSPWTMIVAVLVVAVIWMLVQLLPVLLVLVAALMLVGALNPLVERLEKRGVGRRVGLGIVFGLAVGFTALVLFFTVPPLLAQLKTLIEHEPEIRERVAGYLEASPITHSLAEELRNVRYDELMKSSHLSLLTVTTRAVEIVAYTIASFFLALYFMIDRDRLRGALFSVVPRKHHVRFSRVLLNLETIVGGYIRGQVITCVLMALFIFGLLVLCHVPNALAIAVFGGVMDVLPYVGIFLTMGPAVLAAYGQGPAIALTVFLLLLAYEEFESRVLVPVVYGRALRLPSSIIFFALLVGAALGGIIGALLALPIAAAIVMLLDELRVELPGETILPEDVEVRRKDAVEELEYEARAESAPTQEAAAIAVEIARERKEEEKAEEKAEEAVEKAGEKEEAGGEKTAKKE